MREILRTARELAGVWQWWRHAGGLAYSVGVGQTVPAQSSTLGWPQMKDPIVRKLAKVEHKSLQPGRAAPDSQPLE